MMKGPGDDLTPTFIIEPQNVGQAVDPHFDPHPKVHFCNEKHPKSEDFRCFFGAARQIRTADLILTKDALYRLSYSSK